jgi:hypothetical protein
VQVLLMYTLLGVGSLGVFIALFSISSYIAHKPRRRLFIFLPVRQVWEKATASEENEAWDRLLQRAGRPFGWAKADWMFLQFITGSAVCLLILTGELLWSESFSFVTLVLGSVLSFFLPNILLKVWAGFREEVLSNDIARFINRYATLLENQVPIYTAMAKAARPTRKLKEYVPTLSEWNKDRDEALESFKRRIGIDDAIILVSHMRSVEELSAHQMGATMQRLEWTVDQRRMFRHRKKIKSLGIGYSIIVYPAFYMGLLVAMFPWYKLLTEILDKYLA